MAIKFSRIFVAVALAINSANAFAPSAKTFRSITPLNAYIQSDIEEEVFDPKAGGVGFAADNAILVSGTVDKRGSAIAKDMKHYSKVVKSDIGTATVRVICKGEGQEIYLDPGMSTEKSITLAPLIAVKNALNAIESSSQDDKTGKIYINFAGGDDMMVHEVLNGVQQMVSALELSSNTVEFRSLCEPSFAVEQCGVAVVAVDGESQSEGQIYYNEGEWYTVSEDDLTVDIQ